MGSGLSTLLPSSSFTVCGTVSSFVHVTVVPVEISITAGANRRLLGRSTRSVWSGAPLTSNGAPPLPPEEHAPSTRPMAAQTNTVRVSFARSGKGLVQVLEEVVRVFAAHGQSD